MALSKGVSDILSSWDIVEKSNPKGSLLNSLRHSFINKVTSQNVDLNFLNLMKENESDYQLFKSDYIRSCFESQNCPYVVRFTKLDGSTIYYFSKFELPKIPIFSEGVLDEIHALFPELDIKDTILMDQYYSHHLFSFLLEALDWLECPNFCLRPITITELQSTEVTSLSMGSRVTIEPSSTVLYSGYL